MLNHGHHDPREPHKWKHCPYCDLDGLILIEASEDVIINYLSSLEESELKLILAKLDKS